jgi:hypothetical protein
MPYPEAVCIGAKVPSLHWSVALSGTANQDIPRNRREPLRSARQRAAVGQKPEPRLRSPIRRDVRPRRTTTGSPPTLAGRLDLPAARVDAPSMRRASRDADSHRLDDVGPACRVALDQGSELRGCGIGPCDAQRLKARRELVRLENGFDVLRQACGDLRR